MADDSAEPEAEAVAYDDAFEMQVEAIPGREVALSGVRNTVRVLMRLNAPELDDTHMQRPALQVACVLDCSGSMAGEKLDFAKRAVLKLVKHLDERDTLHFITYDTTTRVIFRDGDLSEHGKQELKSRVQAVHEMGRTNLFGGLRQAAELLGCSFDADVNGEPDGEKAPASDACEESVRRIFLFSDGCVNVGLCDPVQIQRHVESWAKAGVTTSTFGIGQDFDEPLMRGIAQRGNGRYAYLGAAKDIPKLVSKAVHGLLDMYASKATIELRGCKHTSVSCIYGEEEADESGAGLSAGMISLGDLHHGSERKVLVELDVAPPGDAADGSVFKAAEWTLNFQRSGIPVQLSGTVELRTTGDRGALGGERMAVRAVYAIQQAAIMDGIVAGHLACHDRAQARVVKSRQIDLLREAHSASVAESAGSKESRALERVLERAQRVADQLVQQDMEFVRRQCVQERDLNACCSEAGWASACDSDAGDVANMEDLRGHSPPMSPTGSPTGTPPCTPRLRLRLRPAVTTSPFHSESSSSTNSNSPQSSLGDTLPLGARSPPYLEPMPAASSPFFEWQVASAAPRYHPPGAYSPPDGATRAHRSLQAVPDRLLDRSSAQSSQRRGAANRVLEACRGVANRLPLPCLR